MNKQEKIILILGIIIIGLICCAIYLKIQELKLLQFDKQASNNWACMDGCYNMLLVIENVSNFDYHDIKNKLLHDSCTKKCLNLYPI